MKYELFVKDGTLCWTLTSNGYKHMTWNFVLHWRKHMPGQPILVVCADKPSYMSLQRAGVNCRLADSLLPDFGTEIVPMGTTNFAKLNRLKLNLLEFFAKQEAIKTNIYIDGDIVVNGPLVATLQKHLDEHPLCMPCDEKGPDCSNPAACPNLCTGLVAFRHGVNPDLFRITDFERWKACPQDQVWVNAQLAALGVRAATLPRTVVQNGSYLQHTVTNPVTRAATLSWHYNYRVGDGKVWDMKRMKDWLLPF